MSFARVREAFAEFGSILRLQSLGRMQSVSDEWVNPRLVENGANLLYCHTQLLYSYTMLLHVFNTTLERVTEQLVENGATQTRALSNQTRALSTRWTRSRPPSKRRFSRAFHFKPTIFPRFSLHTENFPAFFVSNQRFPCAFNQVNPWVVTVQFATGAEAARPVGNGAKPQLYYSTSIIYYYATDGSRLVVRNLANTSLRTSLHDTAVKVTAPAHVLKHGHPPSN